MKNGTATYADLAILAGSCGLVENSNEGRQAFDAWMHNDQKAARKALFTRVSARREASKRATASAAQQYPSGWLAAAGIGGRRGAAQRSAPTYPSGWLAAAGIGGRRIRITEGSD